MTARRMQATIKDSFQGWIVCAIGKGDTKSIVFSREEEAASRPHPTSPMSLIDDCNELPSMENW